MSSIGGWNGFLSGGDPFGRQFGTGTDSSAPPSTQIGQIVAEAKAILQSGRDAVKDVKKVRSLIRDLEQRLAEPHVFHVFPQYTVAYGLAYTFRQKWEPGPFQVGKLLATVPLAPKETRKIQKRLVLRESRQTKELRRSVRNLVNDSTTTSTLTSEVAKRAEESNSTNVTATGSYGNDEMYKVSGQVSNQRDAKSISEDTKKSIREKTLKALQELREERQIEVDSTSEATTEETSSGEIYNPNEEITVTYLYYELQRQYTVSEKLHKITPVIFVANPFPRPDDVDRTWLIEHEWILRRVILDNSFLASLDLLKKNPEGELLGLQALQAAMSTAFRAVAETKDYIATQERMKEQASRRLDASVEGLAAVQAGEDSEGFLEKALEWFGGSSGSESTDAAGTRRDAAESVFSRIEDGIAAARSRLAQLESAVESTARQYVDALRKHMDAVQQVAALRVHVKQNITYYMQAIWKHEHRDARYFRLFDKQVPFIPIAPGSVTVSTAADGTVTIDLPPPGPTEQRRLDAIADLDDPIGFLGNYMIFPLTRPCHVATEMMTGFLNAELQLEDPDASSTGVALQDLIDARTLLEERVKAMKPGEKGFAAHEEEIEKLTALIEALDDDSDIASGEELVIVPTDMLYVEALPGANPVLENFKLAHRELDAQLARSKVKQSEINNLRMGALLLGGDLYDPEIDKQIFINSGVPLGGTFDAARVGARSEDGDGE